MLFLVLIFVKKWKNYTRKSKKILGKVLLVRKKFVPLHPLSAMEAL